tara:strand:- start:31036 stop:31449 length:414 start_codon:yes stop_codon:yes gene_type:complete
MVIPDSSKRIQRYFELARRAASNSTYGNISHGAILVKGGRVLKTSFNKDSFCSFGARFRSKDSGRATVHAEIGAVLGIPKEITQGANVFVVRVGKRGNFQMSKPCEMCMDVLRFVGVRRVFYTSDSHEFDVIKIKNS